MYEAIYVKVLQPSTLLPPDKASMTEAVRDLYSLLFEPSRPDPA